MKKIMAVLLSVMVICGLSACGSSTSDNEVVKPGARTDSTQIPNPVVAYDDLAAAVKAAGFDLTLPQGVDASKCTFSVIDGRLIDVEYTADGMTVNLRKDSGTDAIDGDYNTYSSVVSEQINGYDVELRSNGEEYHVATYTDGSYAYAVVVSDGYLSHQAIVDLISSLK